MRLPTPIVVAVSEETTVEEFACKAEVSCDIGAYVDPLILTAGDKVIVVQF